MTEIVIDKKKYILIPQKDYLLLQKKAALKVSADKTFSIDDARAFIKNLIKKWAQEK